MTVLTQTQRILSITVVTHNRQHRMVLCSTPSMFFLAVPSVAKSKSFSRQPIVTGTSVLAVKYKDGIMMAADNLGSSYPSSVTLYPINIFPIQASYGSLARFKWRHVRLSIPSACPGRPCHLRRNQLARWAYTRSR